MNVFEHICPACKAMFNDVVENGISKLLHKGLSSSKDTAALPTPQCTASHDYVIFQDCGHCCPEVFEECRACKLGYKGRLDIPGSPTKNTCRCHYAVIKPAVSIPATSIAAGDNTFVSYARLDAELVDKLVADLRAMGVNLWLDRTDIPVGARWDLEIDKALQSCERVLVILSKASVNSENVLNEIDVALEEKKKIIPAKINDCKIPLLIRRLNYIDLSANYQIGFSKLLNSFK